MKMNDNPICFRVDSRTNEMLDQLSRALNVSRTKCLKIGLKLLYESVMNPDFDEDMLKIIVDSATI